METEDTNRIVVGVDGTEGSDGALRYAVEQARERECGLRLVHVGPRYEVMTSVLPYIPQQVEAAGLAILDEARQHVVGLSSGLEVETDLRDGARISELVDAATTGELLVLGRKSHTGVVTGLFGATTAAVVAGTTVPVAVVPDTWHRSADPGPVVVGLRGTEHAEGLLEAAFEHAVQHSVGVDVAHAWQIPIPYAHRLETDDHANKWLPAGVEMVEQTLTPWRNRYPEVPVTVRVVYAQPSLALLTSAKAASLLVLQQRPGPKLRGPHLGKTSRSVIAAAPCPVLILPTSADEHHPKLDLELERAGTLLR
ncbi:MAG: universal stress protein [Ornithinimicrobium sp.]